MSGQKWISCADEMPKPGDVVLYLRSFKSCDPVVVQIFQRFGDVLMFELVHDGLISGRDYDLDWERVSVKDFWMRIPELPRRAVLSES